MGACYSSSAKVNWLSLVKLLEGAYTGSTRRRRNQDLTIWRQLCLRIDDINPQTKQATLSGFGVSEHRGISYVFEIVVTINGVSAEVRKRHLLSFDRGLSQWLQYRGDIQLRNNNELCLRLNNDFVKGQLVKVT